VMHYYVLGVWCGRDSSAAFVLRMLNLLECLACNIQSVRNLGVHSTLHNNMDIQLDQFSGLLSGCKSCRNVLSRVIS